jgi:hypothetical protein
MKTIREWLSDTFGLLQYPLVWFIVIGTALSPCTSGPLVLGYFFGWHWAIIGIAVGWGMFGLYSAWQSSCARKPDASEKDSSKHVS